MIVLLNGAFGIGKTTVAREFAARFPRTLLFDPEWIGIPLQRLSGVDDFQDLRIWRRLTILGLRIARLFRPNIVVPMAFSNPAYLQEIRAGVHSFDDHVVHFCLVAPLDVVQSRLRNRGATEANAPWQYRRASECCAAHTRDEFAEHIAAADRNPPAIVADLIAQLPRQPAV